MSAVFALGVLLTLVMFRLNKVPEPDNGVKSFEKAEMRSVLVVPGPVLRTLPDTFQLLAVSPALETGGLWKVITEESKVKSPWNPTRLSALLIAEVVTGRVKLVTNVSVVAVGRETVATRAGVGVGDGVGIGVGVGVGVAGVGVGVGVGVPGTKGAWIATVMGVPVLKKPTVAFVACGGVFESNRKLYKVPQRIAFAFWFWAKVSEFQVRELAVCTGVHGVLLYPALPTVPSFAHAGS